MKHLMLLLCCLIAINTSSQVGIGTTNPKATLDIPASNSATPSNTDGILIPRVNAFPITSPTAAQNGMLIYLTTDNSFYSWNQGATSWIKILSTLNIKINDLTDGKSDNDGSENGSSIFLGINAGQLDDLDDNQNIGIGLNALSSNIMGTVNVAVGPYSLFKNTAGGNTAIGYSSLGLNTSGHNNSALGLFSLYRNTTGNFNTGIGDHALENNTIANKNTAIGLQSMQANTTGSSNTALGTHSLISNTIGDNNVAIGVFAGSNVIEGSQNTFLGNFSGTSNLNTSKSGCIAIGFEAGYENDVNNRLFIENSRADKNNALIYGEFDTNILRVNGELQIGNQSTTGYKFPTTRGTVNQVLKTDASGVITWTNDADTSDHDFYKVGTSTAPTSITDNIFTHGNIGINNITPTSSLDIVDARGSTSINIAMNDSAGFGIATTSYGIKTTINSDINGITVTDSFGLQNTVTVLGGTGYGVKNIIKTHVASSSNVYGTYNDVSVNDPSAIAYGTYNIVNGSGFGISYGVYSKILSSGYAGYFLGSVAIGSLDTNIYTLPDSRGTNGQFMKTNASGTVTWVTPTASDVNAWGLLGNSGTNPISNFIGTTDNVDLAFKTNNSERLRLTTNGDIKLITDSANAAQLKNKNTFNHFSDNNINFFDTSSIDNTNDAWMLSSRESTTDNSGIYGNRDFVTIWSPGDNSRLIRFLDEDNWSDNDGNPYNNTSEKAYIDNNGQYVQASDKNRKQNFQIIKNPIEKLNKIHGYTYEYKLNSIEKKKGQIANKTSGVIAQELYKVLPEAVQISDNGDYFVHYAGIVPLLIEGLKKQQEIINKQQKDIDKLKQLEARILKLENH
jgi:hypothetical protein